MKKKINQIFEILSNENPLPQTELHYTNEFTLLISIVLSAQSTDISVNKATEKLFKKINSPSSTIEFGLDNLKEHIKTLGLYNNKAQNIISLSQKLIDEHKEQVPTSLNLLESLPGVGSKTARVFLNCAYNIPVIAVDTHVFRVSKRLGITNKNNAKAVEKDLNKIIPKNWKLYAHHWLILHGRYICKARNPNCLICKIKNHCNFFYENFK